MADFEDILYEKHSRVRGAAWITINRPQAMNSFTGQTLTEMREAVEDASNDPEVGVIVLTGTGDRAFCAGGDVRWLQEVQQEGADAPAPVDPHAGIEDCMKPVIARVNGYAVGGGNHLAYFADFTIACEDHAQFAQVGPQVGSPASGYVVAYLTHVVGAKKAKEMWMLCRRHRAKEALEMGPINVAENNVLSPLQDGTMIGHRYHGAAFNATAQEYMVAYRDNVGGGSNSYRAHFVRIDAAGVAIGSPGVVPGSIRQQGPQLSYAASVDRYLLVYSEWDATINPDLPGGQRKVRHFIV